MEQDNRQLRLNGRHALRAISNDERCWDCGLVRVNDDVGVRRTGAGVVGFAGLATCGRIWLCPVCNAKVMARRALEIGIAVAWAQRQGLHLIWGSLTVRHNRSSDLSQLLELQQSAWRGVVNSRRWRAASATRTVKHQCSVACAIPNTDLVQLGARLLPCGRKLDTVLTDSPGRVGYIRAAELTIGERNGWHPHFHPLIFFRGSKRAAEAFAGAVVAEWVFEVEKLGGEARAVGGQQLKVLGRAEQQSVLGGYMTKATYDSAALALELVWSQNKTGAVNGQRSKLKTESHWSLLARQSLDGLGMDARTGEVGRWWELEEAIAGTRMITWSRGLRDFAQLGTETDDMEEAAREVGTASDTVTFITGDGWDSIGDRPEIHGEILRTLESAGWVGLRALLDAWGIEHREPGWRSDAGDLVPEFWEQPELRESAR